MKIVHYVHHLYIFLQLPFAYSLFFQSSRYFNCFLFSFLLCSFQSSTDMHFIFHFCLVLLISVHISSAHHNPIYNTNNSLKWRAWFVAHVDDFSGVVFSEHYSLIVKSSLNFQTKSVQSSYTSELFKSPRMRQTVCSVNFPL